MFMNEELENKMLSEGKTFYRISGTFNDCRTYCGHWATDETQAGEWALSRGFSKPLTITVWETKRTEETREAAPVGAYQVDGETEDELEQARR